MSKRLLIVGASRGLGAEASAYFADRYEVATLKFDYLKAAQWHGRLESIPPSWREGSAAGGWDRIDAVLHCQGGGMGMRGPLIAAASFVELFNLNLAAAAEVNRYVLPFMMVRGAGAICHVCSIASLEAIGSVGYNTVKAALAGYIRSLGREMAPFGVVVTGIAPGGFRSPGGAMERLERANPEAYAEFTDKRLPRGRMGEAAEILPLIELLIGEKGSMMGGSVVPIDAGEGKAYGG